MTQRSSDEFSVSTCSFVFSIMLVITTDIMIFNSNRTLLYDPTFQKTF